PEADAPEDPGASAVMKRSLHSRATGRATIAAVANPVGPMDASAARRTEQQRWPHAIWATAGGARPCAGGGRREMTFETPSAPIETPYNQSAASMVRIWWVMMMNWARVE